MPNEQYAYFFKCFSHPSRNQILHLLAEREELSVEALAGEMDLAESTVSRHLNFLRMQRVVTSRRDGSHQIYSIDYENLYRGFRSYLAYLRTPGADSESEGDLDTGLLPFLTSSPTEESR